MALEVDGELRDRGEEATQLLQLRFRIDPRAWGGVEWGVQALPSGIELRLKGNTVAQACIQ